MNISFAKPLLLVVILGVVAGCGKSSDTKTVSARETVRDVKDSTAAQAPPASDAQAALCAAHKLPVSVCYLCDASLRDPKRLWCQEHSRYEDRCFICHPEARDAARLYCDEHGLYEDECIFCHPDLLTRVASAANGGMDIPCSEHHVPEAECGICHPELADRLEPGQGLLIRFPSLQSAAKAGIESTPVGMGSSGTVLAGMGRLEFDQNHAAKVASPIEGQVLRVRVDLGQEVVRGQVLVELNSRAWGEVLAEEKAAKAALEREETLHRERISSTRDLDEARARYETARAARQAAQGGSADAPPPDGSSTMVLCAPVAGTVVARTARVGEIVPPGSALLEIADLDPLWAMVALPEPAAASLRPGDGLELSAGGSPVGQARIDWIADVIDPSTRMVEVRARVPNPGRTLRAGMFVEARIRPSGPGAGFLVPAVAVARFGGKPFVFLERGPDLFEVRRVELSSESEGWAAIANGIRAGERVVSRQSYLVKSEFQKSRLGAGCVD